LDHDPGGAYPQSVTASWVVAFDRLAVDDATALDLLTVVAWCGPEPVPLSLFTDHPDPLPERLRPVAIDPLVLAGCTVVLHRRGPAASERRPHPQPANPGRGPPRHRHLGRLGLVLWSLGEYRHARQLLNNTLTRSRRI
jgi:hypothetical protein